MDRLLGGLVSILIWFGAILLPVGWLYWLWIAIKIGGFAMFALALFPLTAPIASILGGWSFLFGLPDWAYSVFISK
ncbi:maltose ABC transporter permease [Vibrio fluvialis]|uniref:maltose ABC transporter permease n=1 Tax=Vibrio fluvialis TaxID=676 RepID=UPI0013025F29|nr:maltose ABC transporter permease [Vibrio fluvialis]ELI1839920.1 maltose ABC transporter permease [Vibrio fluvialis]ELS8947829.1 maltose ABC transporter permease [Vibrio fluvialis]EMA2445795.1 maltose ABC transporter permease [Vibrio fluvialis]MBY7826976.1 maltose ABC transporter permease [Vibrio fluvialis]MBY8159579.1 maltose ABC transporter permease [Vibrio fluvialis]